MSIEVEFYQAANSLIEQHGEEAALAYIHKKLEDMEEAGDKIGHDIWMAILRAFGELIRRAPTEGEQVQ